VCVDEEELIACIREVFLDAAAHPRARCGGPWFPGAPGTVGTLRQPTASGRTAEDSAVLGYANSQLKTNTLVARQQGQVPVSGCGADNLDPAGRFERPERADQVMIDAGEKVSQAIEPLSPELYQRKQFARIGVKPIVTGAGTASASRPLRTSSRGR
jgi:hypothetical protein